MTYLKFENILLLVALLVAALCFYLGWPVDEAAAQTVDGGIRFDMTINISAVITVIIMTVGGVAAWVTLRMQVKNNTEGLKDHQTQSAADFAAVNALIKANAERIEQVRAKGADELAKFQLGVAKEYATATAVTAVRTEVVEALNRLSGRIDDLIKRDRDRAE